MRKLIYVPIVHMEADMGSLAGKLKDEYIKQYGPARWEEHVKFVTETWQSIERQIEELRLPYSKVKIYQDGLPYCNKELEMVKEIAEKGSRNYKLILKLVEKGAKVIGTEDPALLVEEYQSILRGSEGDTKERLNKRNAFISRRIDETLGEGETGILFIGLLHRIDNVLPKDVQVMHLAQHLPSRETV